MNDGRDSPNLDPSAAGRLLRAVSVNFPGAPDPLASPDPLPLAAPAGSSQSKPANGEATPHSPVPGFSIERLFGEGGGGTVYRAFREGSDRPLALKVLKAHAGDKAAKRAGRELEILENLRLPCLPRLIDYGEHDGHLYFATEFIEGQHLDEYCTSRSLPLRRRVEILAAVADAAQSLHEHGVIHRDLKPSNIIVADDGQPMLVDLGLAALAETDQTQWTMTEDGAPIGTPAFMAPEQARGERSRISTRTDVYGLGATAYLVLTGSTPHDTNTSIHEAVRRVAQDESRDPRSLSPVLPRPLAAVLRKACEQDPQRRYSSAAEVAADTRRWLRGEAVTAGELSVWWKGVRWMGRHPIIATAAVCVALIGGSIPLSYWIAWHVNRDPARFIVRDNLNQSNRPRTVDLVSKTGLTLATLGGGGDSDVPIATFAAWPAEWRGLHDGKQVVVIGVAGEASRNSTGTEIWICDPTDLTTPLFRTQQIEAVPDFPSEIQDKVKPAPAYAFRPARAFLADIYPDPDHPGLEIVGVFASNNTPTAVSVHDLRGKLLFRAWHTGPLFQIAWMARERLLVAEGDRHGKKTHTWSALQHPEVEARSGVLGQYARTFAALRVDCLGEHEWLDDSRKAGEGKPLAWYKALWPPIPSAFLQPAFSMDDRVPTRDVVRLDLQCATEKAAECKVTAQEAFGATYDKPESKGTFYCQLDATGHLLDPECGDDWDLMFGNDKDLARAAARRISLIDFPAGVPSASAAPKSDP